MRIEFTLSILFPRLSDLLINSAIHFRMRLYLVSRFLRVTVSLLWQSHARTISSMPDTASVISFCYCWNIFLGDLLSVECDFHLNDVLFDQLFLTTTWHSEIFTVGWLLSLVFLLFQTLKFVAKTQTSTNNNGLSISSRTE